MPMPLTTLIFLLLVAALAAAILYVATHAPLPRRIPRGKREWYLGVVAGSAGGSLLVALATWLAEGSVDWASALGSAALGAALGTLLVLALPTPNGPPRD